ncbi:MAG: PIG-L deacetylase family protein [Candidatus Helarchaeota archaeon]
MRVLFFAPHPDDVEFICACTEIDLIKKGHDVMMACFTGGEYGISRDDFKGERLSRIRRRELKESTRLVGVKKLYWMGFIDGYSRFDKESIKMVEEFILKVKPDVIFAPDPFYSVDRHVDHINLAKNVYYVWCRLKKQPIYLLYYTYMPNYYVPARHGKIAREALKKHVSQGFSRPFSVGFSWFVKFLFGCFAPHAVFAEAFRVLGVQRFLKHENPVRMPKLVKKLFHLLFNGFAVMPDEMQYHPTPEQLGLKEFRYDLDGNLLST